MAGRKKSDTSALSLQALEAGEGKGIIGIKKAMSLLAGNGVSKLIAINADGSAISIKVNKDIEKHQATEIDGDFENALLIKRGQNVDIQNESQALITTKPDGSFLETVINFVRDKISLVDMNLTLPNDCKILVGKDLTEITPQATTPEEYAGKILPSIFEKYKVEQPKNKDQQLTTIDEPFQIIVPRAIKEIGFDGKPSFTTSKVLLLIEVMPTTNLGNASTHSHRITARYLDFQGNKKQVIGQFQYFDWKMSDSKITDDQLAFSTEQ